MAGHATRRIVSLRRICGLAGLLALATFANGAWENTRFCRLSDDRVLLIGGNQRFVLTHAAAWELADPGQRAAFGKWLNQSKLPKDLGQLVSSAPADHEVPLAGELDASTSTTGDTDLIFKQNGTAAKPIKVSQSVDGAKLDAKGVTIFGEVAKSLGKPPSTLLVALSDKSGQISDSDAWGAVLARLKAKPEFFVYIDKKLGLLWVRHAESPGVSTQPIGSTTDPVKAPADDQAPKKKANEDSVEWLLPVGIGVVALLAGVGVGVVVGSRRSKEAPRQKVAANEPAPAPRFNVSSNERELVEKVRDETRRLGWPPDRTPTAEEVVVGQMIERFNRNPSLEQDLAKLQSYRQFKEAHDQFQKQIDVALAESKASAAKAADLASKLNAEQSKSQTVSGELSQTKSQLAAATDKLHRAESRVKDVERSNVAFQEIYSQLVNRTAAVCHDIVLTRPRGDAWALAFVYLADYTLAYLGLARQCDDQRTFDAMLTNLARLSEAMAKSFPDRKLVIDPWQRAVKAFGEIKVPTYDQKPHPHVDSLSQIMLTVRDTGPSLSDFREFFAPSDGGLHIIRPA